MPSTPTPPAFKLQLFIDSLFFWFNFSLRLAHFSLEKSKRTLKNLSLQIFLKESRNSCSVKVGGVGVDESCRTYQWIMSHLSMSCVTHERPHALSMRHVARECDMPHVNHSCECDMPHVNDSCEWAMSHVNESCHMSMSHVTHAKESCHARERVMWHTCQVTHADESTFFSGPGKPFFPHLFLRTQYTHTLT